MRTGSTRKPESGISSGTRGDEAVKHRADVLVKCPYYKFEDKQMIYCEGVQEGTAIHLGFDTAPNLRDYKNKFCKRCYNQCLIAQMQNRKWGYDAK